MIHFSALKCTARTILLFTTFIIQADIYGQFSATGSSAGTVTTTSVTQGFDWVNPSNIQSANAVYATSLITGANKSTYYLDAKNWGFQTTTSGQSNYIPPTATINGIEVFITRRRTNTGTIKGNRIILLKAGAESGLNKSTGATWPTTAATIKFGSSVDLWGSTWTPADFVNANFGVRIQARNQGNKPAQAEVDHVQIIVYFNQTFYYSKSSGNLELPATWGLNTDGTGTAPSNFTSNGQVFILRNRAAASLTANLTISGSNSKMVIGDGTSATALTIPSNFVLTSQVDVAAASSITINNTVAPTFNSVGSNTSVTYGATGDQQVQEAAYYNLSLSGGGTKTLQAIFGITSVNNVLTIAAGTVFNNQGNTVIISGAANGISNSGTATGTGRYVYSLQDISTSIAGANGAIYSNLEIDFATTAATRTLTLANAITITGTLTLTDGSFANGANLTMAPGSTISVSDGVLGSSIAASTGYDVIYNPYTSASPKTTANELSGSIRNFTLQTGSSLTVNLNRNLVATGNLTITTGTLDPTTTPYNITVGGNLVNNGTLTLRNNNTTFNGATAQSIGGAGAQTFYNLIVNNAAGGSLVLNVPVAVNNGLTLTNGIVTTSNTNPLTLQAAAAVITGGNSSSFINGPLVHTVSTSSGNRSFPIGKGTFYKPISLSINQASAVATQYTAEIFNDDPPVRALPPTLSKVSEIRFYTVSSSNIANLSNATITINYGPDDGVTDAPNLRIAKSNGGNWENIGGIGSANITGTITSSAFTGLGDFVLANALGGNNVLPLTWVSFSVKKNNKQAELEWQTADEINTAGFEVQRSGNGNAWHSLGQVKSNNATANKYSFIDKDPLAHINLYRIKSIDADGRNNYSKVVFVSFEQEQKALILSPNPVQGTVMNCILSDEEMLQQNRVMIRIIDMHGKILSSYYDKPMPVMKINTAALLQGNYLLSIQANGRYFKNHFVVVR